MSTTTRILMVFVAACVAVACGSAPPTAPTPGASGSHDRRVGDVSGGDGPPPPTASFVLTTAGGSSISGTCSTNEGPVVLANWCHIEQASGRLSGASVHWGRMEFAYTPGGLAFLAELRIPQMGNQIYAIRGDLRAETTVSPAGDCASFTRTEFAGTLEQLGQVSGELSFCP